MAIHHQHLGRAVGDDLDHLVLGQAIVHGNEDGPDDAGRIVHLDQPVRVLAEIGDTVADGHAMIDQHLAHGLDPVAELGIAEIPPLEMGRLLLGMPKGIFPDEIGEAVHFRPPRSDRPMISRMTSPVPPAMRPTRASAQARAIGYSHM